MGRKVRKGYRVRTVYVETPDMARRYTDVLRILRRVEHRLAAASVDAGGESVGKRKGNHPLS